MKREHQETIGGAGSSNGNKVESSSSSTATGKGKLWVEDDQDAGGMDELLAVLGYKIKSNLRSCGSFCAEERKGMRGAEERKVVCSTFNSSLPGKHYHVPSRKDIEAGYNKWRAATDQMEKKEIFIKFMKDKINPGKLDESTLIMGLATPPAAMAAKRAGENVPQLGFIKAIPDVIFVPSATILALVSAKLTKRMLQ